MKINASINDLLDLIRKFPLKSSDLNESSILKESINLFGSLMLQRVKSLLIDYYPDCDFSELKDESSIRDIHSMINLEIKNSGQEFDSKNLWIDHSYRNYGIIGEPYFDVNFNEVFYLTDTGRMWDGYKYSVRDKIASHQKKWIEDNLVFHSTSEIIESLQENRFPLKVMLAMHPQRWTDNGLYWLNEFIAQSIKNIIKKNLYVNEK